MIYHFLLALILAVVVMPKSGADLNELNAELTKKLKAEPTYLMELDGKQYQLDYQERAIIDPRWIDKVEFYNTSRFKDKMHSSAVVMISLKKRKVDDFWQVVEEKHIHL